MPIGKKKIYDPLLLPNIYKAVTETKWKEPDL